MLEAIFNETVNTVTVSGLTQWDYGRKLYIRGVDLDEVSEVHFCNNKEKEAIVMAAIKKGDHVVCDIPNGLLERNVDITAWIYDVGNESGKTVKTIILKVVPRTKPQDFISENPDASGLLEETLNKINQNIKDNVQFKTDLEADQEQFQTDIQNQQNQFEEKINKDQADFKEEVNGLVAGKLINDDVVTQNSTWSSEKISNHPFGNVQGENSVNFESGIEQVVQPKLYGKSTQTTTNGYQLFDASKLPTKTQGGATVTNNGDGSFTISGNGNLTSDGFHLAYTYSHEETVKLLKSGIVRVNTFPDINPYCEISLQSNLGNKYLARNIKEITITDEFLNENSTVLKLVFYSKGDVAIKQGTIKPMLYQTGDGTFEPFTSGQPSPNPNYPQPIISKEVSSIQCCGKNLLENTTYNYSKQYDFTYSHLTIPNIFKSIKPNTKYTLFVYGLNFTFDYFCIMDTNSSNKNSSMAWFNGKNKTVIITNAQLKNITNNVIYLKGKLTDEQQAQLPNMKVMIVEGDYSSQDLPFEEYKGTTITLSKPITLRGLPSEKGNITINGVKYISDVLCEKDGVIGVERNTGYIVYNGNEKWEHAERSEISNGVFVFPSNNFKDNGCAISNRFLKIGLTNKYGTFDTLYYQHRFYCQTNTITLEEWKRELSANNIEVVYQLRTPTFEPLPHEDQDKLKTLLVPSGGANLFANAFIDLNYISSSNYVLPFPIEAELDTVKKSVSDGKTLLATSITNKRVPTNPTDTFATMAGNIDKIKLGSGNATTGDVLSGKTFSNASGDELTGTMPNKNAEHYEATEHSGTGYNGWIGLNIPETGKYNSSTYLWRYARDLDLGNASASDVLSGKTFTSQTSGVKVSGTYRPKVVMLGTVSLNPTVTFNVASKRPNTYQNYTKESFGIYTSSGGDYGDVHFYLSVNSYSYNSSNGILTINCNKNVAYVNNFYCNIAIFLAE